MFDVQFSTILTSALTALLTAVATSSVTFLLVRPTEESKSRVDILGKRAEERSSCIFDIHKIVVKMKSQQRLDSLSGFSGESFNDDAPIYVIGMFSDPDNFTTCLNELSVALEKSSPYLNKRSYACFGQLQSLLSTLTKKLKNKDFKSDYEFAATMCGESHAVKEILQIVDAVLIKDLNKVSYKFQSYRGPRYKFWSKYYRCIFSFQIYKYKKIFRDPSQKSGKR